MSEVFRTRPALVSGACYLVVGLGIVVAGAVLGADRPHDANHMVGGALVALVGVALALAGAARMAARLEVDASRIAWTWAFSRHEVAVRDLVTAILAEPGSPEANSVGAGGTGGMAGVEAFWLKDLLTSVFRASPTLGSRTLLLVRRHGAPIRVKAVGTFALDPRSSPAGAALHAVARAVAAARH